MKRFFFAALLVGGLALMPRPASAADLKILEPADCSLIKGELKFRIQPELAPGEKIVSSPEVVIQDEMGYGLITLQALQDPSTRICSTSLDSTRMRDGYYQAVVKYKSLLNDKLVETEEILTLGVRNGSVKPARFLVLMETREYGPKDNCTVTVRVLNAAGKPMPGARVTFAAPGGTLDNAAAITDSDGEVEVVLDAENSGDVTLTVTVEKLAPVQRVVRFID